MSTTRTAQQLIAQTNELARRFAKLEGYNVAAGHKFYSPDGNGRDRKWWAMACEAQRLLTKTDPDDALRGTVRALAEIWLRRQQAVPR